MPRPAWNTHRLDNFWLFFCSWWKAVLRTGTAGKH